MKNIIAIDLGNLNGKAAILTDEKSSPEFLIDASMPGGMNTTAYVTPDGIIEVNNKITKRRPGRAVYSVKTHFEKGYVDLEENGVKYTADPYKVYAAITNELISHANDILRRKRMKPSYKVVLTYPAAFNNSDKPARIKKCVEELKVDGHTVEVIAMLPEPSAAAIDAMNERLMAGDKNADRKGSTKIVYDLGHGTFDAVLITYTGDKNTPFNAIEHKADPEIGGRVFDKTISDELLRQLGFPVSYTPTATDLDNIEHNIAVKIKHSLSSDNTAYEQFAKPGARDYSEMSVTRQKFQEMIVPYLNITHTKIFELFETAEKEKLTVDEIILTGGSCNIPYVKESLEAALSANGITVPVNCYKPEHAVVFGAARYAFTYTPVNIPNPENDKKTDPVPDPEHDPANKKSKSKKTGTKSLLKQRLESDYCLRSGSTAVLLIDSSAQLPASSDVINITCNSAVAEITVYCTRDKKSFTKSFSKDVFTEIRRFSFDVYPHKNVSIQLTVNDNRIAQLVCKDPNGNIIKEH